MTRLWRAGEDIEVSLDARGWPAAFTWRERRRAIERVRQHWQVDGDWWSEEGRVWREYLAVTTTDGLLCVLYYDLLDGNWRLAKVYD